MVFDKKKSQADRQLDWTGMKTGRHAYRSQAGGLPDGQAGGQMGE